MSMLARLLDACGMELRMQASVVTDSDRDQYRRDKEVGHDQARRNAQRARREVVSIRRPSADEVTGMRRAARDAPAHRPGDSDLRAVPILAALERHGVSYVLVGSYGAIVQGIDLPMTDLDIVPRRAPPIVIGWSQR